MIKLENNERVEIHRVGDKFYTCVCNENGLISFSNMPFLKTKGDKIVFDNDEFNEALKEIAEYNISEEIKNILEEIKNKKVPDPDTHLDFFPKLEVLQDLAFKIYALSIFMREASSFDENLTNQIVQYSNLINNLVKGNDEVVQKEVLKQVPKNWPYSTLHLKPWAAIGMTKRSAKIASGQVDCPARDIGISQQDINQFYSKDDRPRLQAVFDELNKNVSIEKKHIK